jgi:hypothetical protein
MIESRSDITRYSDEQNYELYFFPDKLIYLNYIDGAEIDLNKINEIKDLIIRLVNGGHSCSFVNFKNIYGTYSDDAKKVAAKDKDLVNSKKCEVLFTNTLQIKILAKAYLSVFKPKAPTKVCSKFEEASKFLFDYGTTANDIILLKEFLQEQGII